MLIEVRQELKALGDAMVEALAAVAKARAGTGAGKAVDYAAVEVAIGEPAARIERAGHQIVLQALDVDRPSVMVSGARFAKVGRCEATYYTISIGEPAARIERAGHQIVLQALDVDRPSVMVSGARFAKVGRCEATYYTM